MTTKSRELVSAALAIGIAFPGANASARQLDCELGRYLPVRTASGPAEGSTSGERSDERAQAVFEVSPDQIAMPGLCAPVRPRKFRVNRQGVVNIKAAWRRCAGTKGKVTVRLEIREDCARLVGVRRTGKRRQRIVATISRCGDTRVDPDRGEECDPPGVELGCGRGTSCNGRCVCEGGGIEPPPTSTTTTSTATPQPDSTTSTISLPSTSPARARRSRQPQPRWAGGLSPGPSGGAPRLRQSSKGETPFPWRWRWQ
jgi:hypothetical protein